VNLLSRGEIREEWEYDTQQHVQTCERFHSNIRKEFVLKKTRNEASRPRTPALQYRVFHPAAFRITA
jgi:hypothetical protein